MLEIRVNHNTLVRFKLNPDSSNKEVIKEWLKEDGWYEMPLWMLLSVYNKLESRTPTSPFEKGCIFIRGT